MSLKRSSQTEVKVTGRIIKGLYGHGTRQERQALQLVGQDQTILVRMLGDVKKGDAELSKFLEREVLCEGWLYDSLLLVRSCTAT